MHLTSILILLATSFSATVAHPPSLDHLNRRAEPTTLAGLGFYTQRFANTADYPALFPCARKCVDAALTVARPPQCPLNSPGCLCYYPSFTYALHDCSVQACMSQFLGKEQAGSTAEFGRRFCEGVEQWHLHSPLGVSMREKGKGVVESIEKCWPGGPFTDAEGNCPPRPTWEGCEEAGYC